MSHLISFRAIDRGGIELVGPQVTFQFTTRFTQEISITLQPGRVYNYALVIFIAICAFTCLWDVHLSFNCPPLGGLRGRLVW